MPRVGRNPMKWTPDVYHPQDLTITTIVHIPTLSGYWEQGLNVLKVCLHSLHENTAEPFDLMVFDNASCPEVQDYLVEMRRAGLIQTLLLSEHNVGKTGAWNMLFSAAPGPYVAYMDSDVLFFPGWVEQSLDILKAFPQTGLVSAQAHRWAIEKTPVTLKGVAEDSTITVKTGRFLSEEHQTAQRLGLGYTEQIYQEHMGEKDDVLISSRDVNAYVGAVHFQFLTTKEMLAQVLPFPVTVPVQVDEMQLEVRVNKAGRWQLSTTDYLVHHLGNKLPTAETGFDGLGDRYPQEMINSVLSVRSAQSERETVTTNRVARRILKTRVVQKLVRRINTLTYRLMTADHQSRAAYQNAESIKNKAR